MDVVADGIDFDEGRVVVLKDTGDKGVKLAASPPGWELPRESL